MGILLSILKIIGILLLAVLGILLFLLLLLLFVPICYRGNLSYYDGKLLADGRISYCGPLLRGTFDYTMNSPVKYRFKVLWFTLFHDEKNSSELAQDVEDTAKKVVSDTEDVVEDTFPDTQDELEDTVKDTEDTEEESIPYTEDVENDTVSSPKSSKKQRNTFRLPDFGAKLKEKARRIRTGCKRFYSQFRETRDKAGLLYKLWKTETTRRAIRKVKAQLGLVLRHWKPRKISGRLHYGFSDPADTGEVLGAISMFYAVIGPRFQIQPDFEEVCLEGELHIKGHICLVFLAVAALRIVLNQSIKKTIQRFRKITGGN